jgi:hypothetical protein
MKTFIFSHWVFERLCKSTLIFSHGVFGGVLATKIHRFKYLCLLWIKENFGASKISFNPNEPLRESVMKYRVHLKSHLFVKTLFQRDNYWNGTSVPIQTFYG